MSRMISPGIRLAGAAFMLGLATLPARADAYALRLKGESWLYGFGQKNAYFEPSYNLAYAELLLRAQLTLELGAHTVIESRVASSATFGRDTYTYFYSDPVGFRAVRFDPRVDLLSVNEERLLDGKLTLKLGRQELLYGEGFLVGDGVNEYGDLLAKASAFYATGQDNGLGGAGQYIIPYRFWDAASLSLDLEPLSLHAMVARLHPSQLADPYGFEQTGALLPGLVGAADVAYAGESFEVGLTPVLKRAAGIENTGNVDTVVFASGLRGKKSLGDLELQAEAVLEKGTVDSVALNAKAARFTARNNFSLSPWSTHLRGGLYFFSGDKVETEASEAYDPLFFDWTDYGMWYFGDILSNQIFINSDNVVLELSGGFMPTPVQNLRVLLYALTSQTGVSLCSNSYYLTDCTAETVGAYKPQAVELDVMWDWNPAELGGFQTNSAYYFGALVGAAVPLGALRENFGSAPALEAMLFTTATF